MRAVIRDVFSELCYTPSQQRSAGGMRTGRNREVGRPMQLVSPQAFWRLFESSGSIQAYLAYRRLVSLSMALLLQISLN